MKRRGFSKELAAAAAAAEEGDTEPAPPPLLLLLLLLLQLLPVPASAISMRELMSTGGCEFGRSS